MRRIGLPLLAFVACGVAAVAPADAVSSFKLQVFPLERPAPSILNRIPEEDNVSSITLTVDGSRAATATVVALDAFKSNSTIRLYATDGGEPATLELKGEVRDMLFEPEGEALFLLQHFAAKKRPGDVFLLRIEVATGKTLRELRLPPSAQGLAYWPHNDALLIVCADEIRSILRPGYRSGPLYRLLGVNTSAATLDGSRILVGRTDGVVVVDLLDPQGEEQMPIRGRVDSFEPVRQVAVSRDGSLVLARLEAGGIVPVDPMTPAFGDEIGRGLLIGRPWPRSAPEPRVPQTATGPPVPAAVETPTEAEPEAVAPAPTEAPQATAPATAQIAGSISGPGRDHVATVILSGPDNILHEARRVQPDADGQWHVEGLEPGRYRVQLGAGGDRVLTVEPAFRVLQIVSGQSILRADFRVLDAP
jgi:hypothetical protein